MITLSGYNEYLQLGESSNNQSTYKTPVICPPVRSHLDASSILSYSVYGNHSIVIMNDGTIYAIGDNRDSRIIGYLPHEILNQYTEFHIKDKDGNTYSPISSVCGKFFTLYLTTTAPSSSSHQLILSYKNISSEFPLFLSTGHSNPVALYGGYFNAAAITSDGQILFVNYKSFISSPSQKIDSFQLPGGERAVMLACCKDDLFALSSTGRLFQSKTLKNVSMFTSVIDSGVVGVSGSFWHALAVRENGKVLGFGANDGGRLGLGEGVEEAEGFAEVECMKGERIRTVSAGSTHSLFVSENGRVFACGSKTCGELLLGSEPSNEFEYVAVETTVSEGATVAVAGDTLSAVFVGAEPVRSPNKRIE